MLVFFVIVTVVFLSIPGQDRHYRRLSQVFARRRRTGRPPTLDMGILLKEVATRLRSGASVERAWERSLECSVARLGDGACAGRSGRAGRSGFAGRSGSAIFDDDGVPVALRNLHELSWWQRKKYRISPATASALPATFFVCRMAHSTGAPVADVLDSCAQGITEAGEARAARDIALAGPQTSAFMLAALPVVGILFGTMMGAHPVQFFTGSFLGMLVLTVGLGIEAVGVWWVRRLIARAVRESQEL